MMSRRWNQLPTLILLLLTTSCLTGCASFHLAQAMKFDLDKPFPWETDDDEIKVPARLVVVWKDTILNQRNKLGVRGFGGRIMFYDEQGTKPIKVAGNVAVYAFDNTGAAADATPDRKFIFKAEEMEKHYSKSALGHSYSFWVPWGEVGGEPRKISLLVRFEGESGAIIMSDASTQTLPGIPKGFMAGKSKQSGESSESMIQQAAYAEIPNLPNLRRPVDHNSQMETETISVSQTFMDRHLSNPQNSSEVNVNYSNEDIYSQPNGQQYEPPAELNLQNERLTPLPSNNAEEYPLNSAQTGQYQPEGQKSAEQEIAELRASLEAMRNELSQRHRPQTGSDSRYQSWARQSERQIPLSSLQGGEDVPQNSLRARYEQHLRQAQTSGSGQPDLSAGHSQPTRAALLSRQQMSPQSREQQTEWEWSTPGSPSTAPYGQ
ncbi:MAG: hypothetical protein R3C11_11420 [Planctomycetaceae bacterium]